ncbi:MAG: ABC transporter permease [Chloroherpetonaceae bacterium]|nr:ABC transporter permease [Chthonomonadaceae bacterium]MDW8208194.1 ABC transporter permease [Chloroherpetonaceae bacterium]
MMELEETLRPARAVHVERVVFSGRDNVLCAIQALQQNWMRSLLTMTGIVIGVLAIVTLVAILKGVKTEVARQVEGLGANLVIVVPGKLNVDGQPVNPVAMMGISTLTEQDVEALRRVPGVEQISPVAIVSGVIETEEPAADGTPPGKPARRSASAAVVATNRDGVVMNPTPLAEGRYFDASEEDQNVCILCYGPARDLFGDTSPLGRTVIIQKKKWRVIGVLSKPENDGTLGNQMLGLSTFVYIPFEAAKREIPGLQTNRIVLRTDYQHPARQMIQQMHQTLLQAHNGREDFGLLTQEKGLEIIIRLVNMAQSLLVLIAAISLFVAGVGIMNIMLVTVTERTREIGIRKTVGARRSDIFLQFLTEAVILSVLGGGAGIGLSALICGLIARFSPLTPEMTPSVIGMALGVCIAVGVLFGVTPAMRAARMDPIEAMRHE